MSRPILDLRASTWAYGAVKETEGDSIRGSLSEVSRSCLSGHPPAVAAVDKYFSYIAQGTWAE